MSMAKVTQSVTDIERKLTKIDAMTSKGAKNMSVKDVLKMNSKGQSIQKEIAKGVKEYANVTPTEAEAQAIMVKMRNIVNLQCKQMDFAVENKPIFDGLHIAGLVKKNLSKNEQMANDLARIMVEKAPASLKDEAKALAEKNQASFGNCLKVYSNATGGEDHADEAADDSD